MRSLGLRGKSRGAVAVTVTAMLAVLLAFGAMAVDLAYLVVIRNQLQNAADAGALAAARVLYVDDGQAVNSGANSEGYQTAIENLAQNEPVEVQDPTSNAGDVQRGHWSFADRTFTANGSLDPVDLWDSTTAELDADTDFINAVRVRVRREATPAAAFLSRIMGYTDYQIQTEAVAYIGFAGTLGPGEVDQPIAICKQSLIDSDSGAYTCHTGRMIDSGGGATHNTAGWTNFTQPCETASASSVRPLICSSGNPGAIVLGGELGTSGGMQSTTYDRLRNCWLNQPVPKDAGGRPTVPWNLSLPVIDCTGKNVSPCSEVVGAVNLDIVWVKESGADPQYRDVPFLMNTEAANWACSTAQAYASSHGITVSQVRVNDLNAAQRTTCWTEFATAFNLRTADDYLVSTLSPSETQKTILFLPNCTPHEPLGRTGGENFGILAQIPALVN